MYSRWFNLQHRLCVFHFRRKWEIKGSYDKKYSQLALLLIIFFWINWLTQNISEDQLTNKRLENLTDYNKMYM
jgi:hypothetical protein